MFALPFQQVVAVKNAGQVRAFDGRVPGLGARRDNDVLCLPGLAVTENGPLPGKHRVAFDHRHLAGLHHLFNALAQSLHHGVFAGVHGGEVIARPLGPQTQGFRMGHGVVGFGGVEQRLGGHTAPVQAGAAQLVLLKEHHRAPGSGGFGGGGIPAGTAADDGDIVAHGFIPPFAAPVPPDPGPPTHRVRWGPAAPQGPAA